MDNLEILIQAILSLKDVDKSKNQILDELPELEKQLKSDENARVKIVAGLDITESKKIIQSQLGSITNQPKAPVIEVDIDVDNKTTVQDISARLKDVRVQAQQTVGTVNQTTQSITNLVDKFTRPIKPIFDNNGLIDAEKTIEEVQQHFKELGQISVKGVYGDTNAVDSLDKMIVKVKTLSGETRSLNFELDKTGNAFYLKSGTSDNSGIIKLIQDIKNAIADYEQKIAQFKSTNSELLSGLTTPIAEFESKLAGLKNGTASISEVANAYKALNTEASKITANFNRQLNPIDAAIRSISKGEETIKGLRAEFAGLNNAPKEINTDLNKCVKLLENVKNIEAQQGHTQDWSKAYREWTISVDSLTSKLRALKKEQSNASSTQIFKIDDLKNNNIAYMSKVYNTIEKQMSSIQNMAKKQGWNIVDVKGIEDSAGKIKQLNLTIRDTEGALKQVVMLREKLQGSGKSQYGLVQSGDIKILQTATQAESQLAVSRTENLKRYGKEIDATISKLNTLQNSTTFKNNASNSQVTQVKAELTALIGEYQKLQTKFQGNVTPEGLKQLEADLTQLNSRFITATKGAANLQTALANTNGVDKQRQKIDTLIARIEAYKKANPKAMKQFGSQIESMLSELKGGNLDKTGVDKISKQFQILRLEIQRTGKTGKGFFETLTDQAKKFSSWMTLTGVITSAWHSIKQMVSNVIELDNSLLELSKVSDLSAEGLRNITKEAYSLGEEVGKTGTQVIDAITNFKRAGFSIEDSTNFAEDALILTNVAEGINDAGEAATALISIMKGYHDTSPEFSQKILDAINEVSNTQAINFDDLVDGSQRLSAVAKQAGMSFEQMLGVLTGTNEVLQNIEKTSAGEITIFTRLQAIQLPDEEDVMPLAKLQSTINTATKGAVDIVDQSTGELRNVYDILNDINDVWDTLDKNTQEGIAFAAAGTRQKNVFLSMMENWENVENATNSAMDSMGSSTIENQKYLDSIQGKLANLESSFQSLSQTVVNSDLIKFAVGLGTDLINLLDGLISKLGAIPTLLTAISAGLAFKNVGELLNTPVYAQPQLICA